MRVNLGCGENKLEGWQNIDINSDFKPEHVLNIATQLLPFKDNSVDELWCCHTIEHIEKKHHEHLILEIQRVLKIGCLVYFSYPEFWKCVKNWKDNYQGRRDLWEATIFGRQTTKWDRHVCIMDTAMFTVFLEYLGFICIASTSERLQSYNSLVGFEKTRNVESRETVLRKEIFDAR